MRPGRGPVTRRWDLALLLAALIGAARDDDGVRCGGCGQVVEAGATCCPEPCS